MNIGDTPAQLGKIEAADAMMIDGKIVTRDDYRALAAQVEMLQSVAEELRLKLDAEQESTTELKAYIGQIVKQAKIAIRQCSRKDFYIDEIEKLDDIIDKAPQQHLRELRAEAGRAGFVAGATDAAAYIAKQLQSGATDINLELAPPADKYAETIRQGGTE